MARLEDQTNKHEWCLLRTMVQPNAGWGTLCESCTFRFEDLSTADFPCRKWGAKHPPYPNLLRYCYAEEGVVDDVLNRREIKISDVMGKDFVEICSAFTRGHQGNR